jgi:hypothetical protein
LSRKELLKLGEKFFQTSPHATGSLLAIPRCHNYCDYNPQHSPHVISDPYLGSSCFLIKRKYLHKEAGCVSPRLLYGNCFLWRLKYNGRSICGNQIERRHSRCQF